MTTQSSGELPLAALIDTPMGAVGIDLDEGVLLGVDLLPRAGRPVVRPTRASQRVVGALRRYFDSPGRAIELPLRLRGTAFQRRVWTALRGIPSGQAATYGELARRLGTSARAVGAACRANPIPIVVPCHRVVAAAGLGGFAGARSGALVAKKRWLLEHEGHVGLSSPDASHS